MLGDNEKRNEKTGGNEMNPIVESLYREGNPDAEAVDKFIQQNQFPLVEPGHVTFVE